MKNLKVQYLGIVSVLITIYYHNWGMLISYFFHKIKG